MSQEKMAQLVDEQFGGHQIVKTGFMRVPCIVVTSSDGYDYKYKNHPICMAICEHVKNDPDVYGYWYVFKFDSKTEAKSFAKKMVAVQASVLLDEIGEKTSPSFNWRTGHSSEKYCANSSGSSV